jgi:putative transposase
MPDIFRTYKLKHHSNNIKLSVLYDVVKEYRYTSNIISNHLWVLFFKERVMFKDYNDIKHIKSKLSERYKQTCQTQVVGQNKSYISNMKNRFVDIVHKSSLNEQDKIQLFYINKYN